MLPGYKETGDSGKEKGVRGREKERIEGIEGGRVSRKRRMERQLGHFPSCIFDIHQNGQRQWLISKRVQIIVKVRPGVEGYLPGG